MAKTPADSYTEQVQILNQSAMNGSRRLFGGRLMEWIDIVAAVVARRHSNRNVTTVLVDTLEFKAPAMANELVVLTGKIIYSGRTSMEICVRSFVEHINGERSLINSAFVTMVALDENSMPCPVPELVPVTDEEKRLWNEAREKVQARKNRRMEKNGPIADKTV